MNCPKCGEELLNVNGKYICSKCGIEVPEDQTVAGGIPIEKSVNQESVGTEPDSSIAKETAIPVEPLATGIEETGVEPKTEVAPPIIDIKDNSQVAEMSTETPSPDSQPVIDNTKSENIANEPQPSPIPPVPTTIEEPPMPINMAKEVPTETPLTTAETALPSEALNTNTVETNIAPPEAPVFQNQDQAPGSGITGGIQADQSVNRNVVQPTTSSTPENQAPNMPDQDEGSLDKKKKLLLILAICGGGLLFLIIGLLVGYFYNA